MPLHMERGKCEKFCNSTRQKTICIIAEKKTQENKEYQEKIISLSLHAALLSLFDCRAVDDRRRMFLTMFQMGNGQIECKNGKLLKTRVQLSVKWVCQPQYEVVCLGGGRGGAKAAVNCQLERVEVLCLPQTS